VCDLETSRMGAPYIYDISRLRVNIPLAYSHHYTGIVPSAIPVPSIHFMIFKNEVGVSLSSSNYAPPLEKILQKLHL